MITLRNRRNLRRFRFCLFIAACGLLSGAGCGRGPQAPVGGPAPEPAHPAMRNAPGTSSPSSPQSLPAGHPQVSTPAPESPAPAPTGVNMAGQSLQVGPVTLTVPEGWIRKSPRPFTLAVFGLPRAEGDPEDGGVTVSMAGGGIEGNISRWQGQFKENPAAQRETLEVGGMKAITVRLAGTFGGGGGPMVKSGAEKPNWKMWGAIIELPGQSQHLFLKALGPAKTLDRWDQSLTEFLKSLKKTQ